MLSDEDIAHNVRCFYKNKIYCRALLGLDSEANLIDVLRRCLGKSKEEVDEDIAKEEEKAGIK